MMNTRTLSHQDAVPAAGRDTLQKLGGLIALVLGLFYTAFVALFLFLLPSLGFDPSMFRDPPRFVAFVLAHYSPYFVALLAGVLVSPTIVVLVRALDERMRATAAAPSLMAIGTAFGYISAIMLFLNWLF